MRVKMAAAVQLARLFTPAEVDWALGHAAVQVQPDQLALHLRQRGREPQCEVRIELYAVAHLPDTGGIGRQLAGLLAIRRRRDLPGKRGDTLVDIGLDLAQRGPAVQPRFDAAFDLLVG